MATLGQRPSSRGASTLALRLCYAHRARGKAAVGCAFRTRALLTRGAGNRAGSTDAAGAAVRFGEGEPVHACTQALVEELTGLGLPPDYNPLSVPEDVLLAAKTKAAQRDDYPREPAEGEVTQVMQVCSGCAREPFKKVELISWPSTPKKLYSGALYTPATPQCRKF
ncbi:Uncharacterized protein GBIM_18117 [Gryllus bimaculatus]|nr:Uncharacterized protein GBIM_18117 [Gryllus bimaculatus]